MAHLIDDCPHALDVFENALLTSLAGLDTLETVEDSVFIYDNAALETLTGLDALTDIGGRLALFRNDALVSLDGLDSLETIGGNLEINFNFSLTSLAAISSLTDDDIGGEARIFDNDNLDCAAQNLQFTIVGICN